MKSHLGVVAALFLMFFGPVVAAQSPASLIGKEAPPVEFTECVNEPEAKSLEECKGDVVFLKFWGTN